MKEYISTKSCREISDTSPIMVKSLGDFMKELRSDVGVVEVYPVTREQGYLIRRNVRTKDDSLKGGYYGPGIKDEFQQTGYSLFTIWTSRRFDGRQIRFEELGISIPAPAPTWKTREARENWEISWPKEIIKRLQSLQEEYPTVQFLMSQWCGMSPWQDYEGNLKRLDSIISNAKKEWSPQ